MDANGGILESLEKVISGFREIMLNFNNELYAAKTKLTAAEKKRSALLNSLMYRKFNVVQGYDFAKQLRDLTEEIYGLKLSITQMNKIYTSIKPISAFINNTSSKSIKRDAVNEVRGELITNYRAFINEKADEDKDKKDENKQNADYSAAQDEDESAPKYDPDKKYGRFLDVVR